MYCVIDQPNTITCVVILCTTYVLCVICMSASVIFKHQFLLYLYIYMYVYIYNYYTNVYIKILLDFVGIYVN